MVQSFWHSFVSYKKAPFLWWLWVSGIQQPTLMVTAWAEVTHLTGVSTCWLWSDAAGPEGRFVRAGRSLGVQAKCVNLERTQSIERNKHVHTHGQLWAISLVFPPSADVDLLSTGADADLFFHGSLTTLSGLCLYQAHSMGPGWCGNAGCSHPSMLIAFHSCMTTPCTSWLASA